MAVAFPSSTSATSSDGGGGSSVNVSVPVPSGLAEGDTWIITGFLDSNGSGTIATPSGFTAAEAQLDGDTGYPHQKTFWKIAGASESAVTVTANTGVYVLYCTSTRVTGAHASAPIGNIGTAAIPTGSVTTVDAPDITIQGDGSGAYMTAAASPDSGGFVSAFTVPSGATELQVRDGSSVFPAGGCAYQQVDAGSFTPGTWTVAGGGSTCEGVTAQTFEILPAATGDNLLADDIESAPEVTSPAIGQTHALNAGDTESASEVTSPAIGQTHALNADDIESAPEVTSPALGQIHALAVVGTESAVEVSAPVIGQVHSLAANDVGSASEVSAPSMGGETGLLAEDVEAQSELPAPALAQIHALFAVHVESTSEVTAPALGIAAAATPFVSRIATPLYQHMLGR